MYIKKITNTYNPILGCDPEFFFTIKGKTIGAEKILPKNGITITPQSYNNEHGGTTAKGKESKIIIDGIQAELNPRANTCRANLGNEISQCFKKLYEKLKEYPEIETEFTQTVDITPEEMDSLDESSKQFGCTPSQNAYKGKNEIKIKDASKYYKRSAGGHIHLGHGDNKNIKNALEHPEMVHVLDIILGNTCVLIDQNKGNIERRKNYGRAGEYRTPPHGLEYRTLSNFWLRNYVLMSFVTGMARLAVNIVINNTEENNYIKALKEKVTPKDIKNAINKNNFKLAYKNFKAIEPILLEITPTGNDTPINNDNIKEFHYFIEKGLNHWFKENPLEHWIKLPEGHDNGWETFLKTTVKKELETK